MNRARASVEAVAVATKDVQAITIGLHSVATIEPIADRRSTAGAAAAFAAGAAVLPGSGFEGSTTLGAAGTPDSADRAALIISAGERPTGLAGAAAATAVAGLAATGAVAAGAAPAALFARMAAMMSAGDFGAPAGAAAAVGAAEAVGAIAAGAAAEPLPARMAAMMSAGLFGAAGFAAGADAAASATVATDAGDGLAGGDAAGTCEGAAVAAAAFAARILSMILPEEPGESVIPMRRPCRRGEGAVRPPRRRRKSLEIQHFCRDSRSPPG